MVFSRTKHYYNLRLNKKETRIPIGYNSNYEIKLLLRKI